METMTSFPRAGYEMKTVRITNLHRSLKPGQI